jgi:hypothetical protein
MAAKYESRTYPINIFCLFERDVYIYTHTAVFYESSKHLSTRIHKGTLVLFVTRHPTANTNPTRQPPSRAAYIAFCSRHACFNHLHADIGCPRRGQCNKNLRFWHSFHIHLHAGIACLRREQCNKNLHFWHSFHIHLHAGIAYPRRGQRNNKLYLGRYFHTHLHAGIACPHREQCNVKLNFERSFHTHLHADIAFRHREHHKARCF